MAEALYRKYRPQVFEDVVGQEHIERTIKNAISQDKVSHAYLFCGPRGTGKTTTARLLAKALLCEKGLTSEPDGTCENCLEIAKGEHPDVYELDAASRTGVENVREEIIGRVQFSPTRGRYKVYIIDEVHMLSTAAFNALLKTLEEPPDHVVFILCTTDPQKVPETIHSRCQRFDFHRISNEAIVARLGAICVAEDVEFDGDALDLIAYRAEGGMRDALTSLEQLISFGEGKVTLDLAERLLGSLEISDMAEIVRAIGQRDIATCFQWTASYVDTGSDLAQFVRDLTQHTRNMYVMSVAGNDVDLEISEATRRELISEMDLFGPDRLARMLSVLGDLASELKTASNPRLSFEIALTRLVRPDSDLTLDSLAQRVEALESGYSAVSHVVSTHASTPAKTPSVTQKEPASSSATSANVSKQEPSEKAIDFEEKEECSHQEAPVVVAKDTESPASQPSVESSSAQTVKEGSIDWANPAVLQRTWQAVVNAIKKQKTAHGALFINTHVHFDDAAQELVIEFPNSFSYTAVQKADITDQVKESLQKAAGQPTAFRFTQKSAEASHGAQAATRPAEVSVSAFPTTFDQVQEEAAPVSQAASVPKSEPTADSSLSQTAALRPQAEPEPTSSSAPQTSDETVPLDAYEQAVPEMPSDDISSVLAAGFGIDVPLEEVREDQ